MEGKPMIIRTHKSDNFTIIDNKPLRDEKLNWAEKGIMAYLLSLPDDWQVYVSELAKHANTGRDTTGRLINKLVEKGYIKRGKRRTEKGKFQGYEYDVYETGYRVGKTVTEKPLTEKPSTDNPSLLSTKDTNTNNTNKKPETLTSFNNPDAFSLEPYDNVKLTAHEVELMFGWLLNQKGVDRGLADVRFFQLLYELDGWFANNPKEMKRYNHKATLQRWVAEKCFKFMPDDTDKAYYKGLAKKHREAGRLPEQRIKK